MNSLQPSRKRPRIDEGARLDPTDPHLIAVDLSQLRAPDLALIEMLNRKARKAVERFVREQAAKRFGIEASAVVRQTGESWSRLSGFLLVQPSQCTSVCAGSAHSMAVTDQGKLFTWGLGGHGRLGHGDEEKKLVPVEVQALLAYRL